MLVPGQIKLVRILFLDFDSQIPHASILLHCLGLAPHQWHSFKCIVIGFPHFLHFHFPASSSSHSRACLEALLKSLVEFSRKKEGFCGRLWRYRHLTPGSSQCVYGIMRGFVLHSRAALSRNWRKMVIILIFGFWGSFDGCICFQPSYVPWRSKQARCSLNSLWKNLLPPASVGTHDSPSLNTAKIRPQNKPKSNAKRQNKNKHHF